MTRAEQLEKEYDELTEKQATVIKDRDALKQVRPSPPPPLPLTSHHQHYTPADVQYWSTFQFPGRYR